MILSHVSIGSNDLVRARVLYDPLMQLLGLRVLNASEKGIDYGANETVFSIEKPVDGKPASAGNGVHIAFAAEDRGVVRKFHETGLANGATDEGKPGLRPEYDANYYGAFIRDADGNKIEAVTFSAD
ncbi:MAG TPA: VOC family protein [Casimicrobiaceae bacterium]|nr:VOC family protein [Casimicrobiaceae bacterium]